MHLQMEIVSICFPVQHSIDFTLSIFSIGNDSKTNYFLLYQCNSTWVNCGSFNKTSLWFFENDAFRLLHIRVLTNPIFEFAAFRMCNSDIDAPENNFSKFNVNTKPYIHKIMTSEYISLHYLTWLHTAQKMDLPTSQVTVFLKWLICLLLWVNHKKWV